jgi:hypothetical protein
VARRERHDQPCLRSRRVCRRCGEFSSPGRERLDQAL